MGRRPRGAQEGRPSICPSARLGVRWQSRPGRNSSRRGELTQPGSGETWRGLVACTSHSPRGGEGSPTLFPSSLRGCFTSLFPKTPGDPALGPRASPALGILAPCPGSWGWPRPLPWMVPGPGPDDPRDGDPLAQPSRCHGTRSPCRMPLSCSLLMHKAGSQLSAGMCGAYQALLARLRPQPGSLSAARGAEAGPPCLFPTAGKPPGLRLCPLLLFLRGLPHPSLPALIS